MYQIIVLRVRIDQCSTDTTRLTILPETVKEVFRLNIIVGISLFFIQHLFPSHT